jgi:plastocyanin
MTLRARLLLTAAVTTGTSLLAIPAFAVKEKIPTVEARNVREYIGEKREWSPPETSVPDEGGVVNLANKTGVSHGVEWKGGPETPSCNGSVPVGTSPAASGPSWSGSCTFNKPGTYVFWCTVHGSEMTETITVKAVAPSIKKVTPAKGPAAGGTTVTIVGAHLGEASAVHFGASEAVSFEKVSSTLLTAVSPAEVPGKVQVSVTTPAGTSASTKAHFKYLKPKT